MGDHIVRITRAQRMRVKQLKNLKNNRMNTLKAASYSTHGVTINVPIPRERASYRVITEYRCETPDFLAK